MVVFDATFLSVLFHPNAGNIPIDDRTGKPVTDAQARIKFLVKTLSHSREKIVIPTPALSEFLVLAKDSADEYVREWSQSSVFRIVDFDSRAAVESAAQLVAAKSKGDKKSGADGDWQKIKVDRQIVAIAVVAGARTIYSTDSDIFAISSTLPVVHFADLPVPPPKDEPLPLVDQDGHETPPPSDTDE